MNLSLLLGCVWVVASAIVAMMPMRWQYPPGLALLLAAPVLLIYIGLENGWIWAGLGALAFLSMFRNPLIYLMKKALGLPVSRPPRDEGAV